MAYVCDRCLGKDAHTVSVIFRKRDKYSGSGSANPRHMLTVPMDLCETCINEFLKDFGKWKARWMKEADPESKKGEL